MLPSWDSYFSFIEAESLPVARRVWCGVEQAPRTLCETVATKIEKLPRLGTSKNEAETGISDCRGNRLGLNAIEPGPLRDFQHLPLHISIVGERLLGD